ncbi:MAG: rod shape-determining protein RodA [Candidatus Eremiobacteraeota bacterium]|nr:rod shape-determining protein RodA [Candidatus Eremiobacteraeota bacterium]MCW5871005.1 rod shape-determining protein RodA [Candidatus Eremiobacteraeota bacterium]
MDPTLLVAWLALVSLGWLLIYSTTYYQPDLQRHALRQGIFIVAGLAVQVYLSRQPLKKLLDWSPWLYGASLALLLAVPLVGLEVNGARRWLSLGSLGALQPSELLKFTLPLVQVRLLRKKRWDLALIALLVPALLVLKQPDLGTAACYAAATWGLLFIAEFDWRALVGGTLVTAWLGSHGLHSYQKERLLMFLDPEKDATGAGWNLIQAKIAVGSGGLQGLGAFQGLQKRLMYVPEQHTDFLFTVLAEEWGLFGGTLVLLLFGLLVARGFRLARRAATREGRWLCAAACWSLAFQTVVNLAMVIGLFPVTGIPLPLLSYGGTALLSQCALLGLLHSEARAQHQAGRAQARLQWAPRG